MRKCIICGQKNYKVKGKSVVERHHISHYPEAVIELCRTCHHIISRYERGSAENWDTKASDVISVYNGIKPSAYISQTSEVVSIRISRDVYNMISSLAIKKGMNASAFIKWKVEGYIATVNAVKPPLYNPAIHKSGDRVLIRRGKKLIETIIPELDAEGDAMPGY